MNKRTLSAIHRSIAKWEAIVSNGGKDNGTENCALCAMFWKKDCKNCPVALSTGTEYCHKSPYDDWIEHHDAKHGGWIRGAKVECNSCRHIAKNELKFLQSLLPATTEPIEELTLNAG